MKKLQLQVETLHVESFAAEAPDEVRGTVNGHQEETVYVCGSGSPCYTNPDYTVTCVEIHYTCGCQHTS